MRKKRDTQGWLEFQPSNLQVTNEYFARYEGISKILDETPKLLQLVHHDLELALELENREATRRGDSSTPRRWCCVCACARSSRPRPCARSWCGSTTATACAASRGSTEVR